VGPLEWQGKVLERWEETFPREPQRPIVRTTLLVDQSVRNATQAYLSSTVVQPFGVPLATVNATYSEWRVGQPPASAFEVLGLASCPMDCGYDDDAAGGAGSGLQHVPELLLRTLAATGRHSLLRRYAARIAAGGAGGAAAL
jgi:hypothetical protein